MRLAMVAVAVVGVMAVSPVVVRAQGLIRWSDLPAAVQAALGREGISGTAAFDAWRDRVRAANAARLRDGDFDHLIHYALQSPRLTSLPPIEPALSAKAFVEAFPPEQRARLLGAGREPEGDTSSEAARDRGADPDVLSRVPRDAQARLAAMAKALAAALSAAAGPSSDARLAHFRDVVRSATSESGTKGTRDTYDTSGASATGDASSARGPALDALLRREYVRAMRFLYEKEFVAERSAQSAADVASLYRTRGHSSDTEIEAGYGVYIALASMKAIAPARRIRRVLIVGPGLDLAPRTALLEEADPQSYQPFAVADALLGLGLSDRATLRIDAADLNPHVAGAIARAVRTAPPLRLFVTSGIADDRRTQMTDDYRAYLTTLGRAIEQGGAGATGASGSAATAGPTAAAGATRKSSAPDGHVRKVIAVAPDVQAMIAARQLDMVTDRIVAARGGAADAGAFDLVVVTNVFPYLADAELSVALANIAAALAPGGLLIHNEARPLMMSATTAVGLPAILARTLLIAKAPAGRDLYDTVWIHQKP